MLGASCCLEVSETVVSEENLKRQKKVGYQPHQGMHPVLVCQWNPRE